MMNTTIYNSEEEYLAQMKQGAGNAFRINIKKEKKL